ncbi:MAG TPA: exosortase-dependent surface protein XDP1, partial [Rhodocyclaceae bacterium]|nr:exosortase-dependent surface protein XDP1 [Rhodocyclaceae bacterium]
MKRITFTALATLAALAIQPAFAATTWDFTTGGTYIAGSGGSIDFGDSIKFSSGGVTVTASAWSNTAGSASVTDNTTALQTAYLGQYSGGLGVTNQDGSTGDANEGVSPEHAIDNDQRYDSVLLSFSQKTDLSSLSVGWWQTDADVSLLAYTGTGTPVLAGQSYSQLIADGWTVIGNYADVGAAGSAAVSTSVSSSYWLVGAYNPLWGGSLSSGNDYFKIATATATVTSSSSSSSSSGG